MTGAAATMLRMRRVATSVPRARGYSTTTTPGRRAVLPRLLAYTTAGAALFYGGSYAIAQRVPAYREFFEKNVYGGEALLRFFATHELKDLPDELRKLDVEQQVVAAAKQVRSGFQRMTDYVRQNEQVQATREEVEKQTAALQTKLHDQLEELKTKASQESSHLLTQAQNLAGQTYQGAREQIHYVAEEAREHLGGGASSAPQPAQEPASTFSAADRKLVAPKDLGGRLRADPQAPVLPQLTKSVKSLHSSEPVLAQLASTIDELTALVREAPHAGVLARSVLETAQADLAQLSARLDEIKKSDAEKLDAQLEKQAQAFEAELQKAAERARSELSQRDTDWAKKVSALQDEQASQFKARLANELRTQSALIDERLKEEVVARGIELQRKWSQEIHSKVEQERAGRLARLDEMASELKRVERLSLENAQSLDHNMALHALSASVRTLREAIDAPVLPDSAYVRHTFVDELAAVKAARKAQDNEVINAALTAIEETGAPSAGVESLPTLHEWFAVRLAPRLTSVALLPEQGAGVLSYLASMMLSPFLFARQGHVPGDDVASIVARAGWLLERRDLDQATRELNQLRGWAKVLVSDWLQAARTRLEVDQALDLIERESAFASLLQT
ncbi:MICOS complex subunit mic60 [Malassezia equina]|uniref:MICOS complex subunit MIC60 n=1 Tax=Malassezia equina TaxID=1381935 RepID=A0AAF0EG89_9BASI|nr:MICOS complex subunit mic60 [Malassezia equina]